MSLPRRDAGSINEPRSPDAGRLDDAVGDEPTHVAVGHAREPGGFGDGENGGGDGATGHGDSRCA